MYSHIWTPIQNETRITPNQNITLERFVMWDCYTVSGYMQVHQLTILRLLEIDFWAQMRYKLLHEILFPDWIAFGESIGKNVPSIWSCRWENMATNVQQILVFSDQQMAPSDRRDHVEVCPEAGIVIQQLCERISQDGGCALLADYGHDGDKGDTFRVRRIFWRSPFVQNKLFSVAKKVQKTEKLFRNWKR